MRTWLQTFALLACLCIVLAEEQTEAITANSPCKLEVFAVGRKVASAKELASLVKKKAQVLIGFSAASCRSCCHFESLYNESLQQLPSTVNFVRVDVDDHQMKSVAPLYKVEGVPSVVLVHKRRAVKLEEEHTVASIIALVERVVTPLPLLSGGIGVEPWLDAHQYFVEALGQARMTMSRRQFIRVTAVLSQDGDADDVEDVTAAALAFSGRPQSTRFGYVAGKAAAQEIAKLPLLKVTSTSCSAAMKQGQVLMVTSLIDGEYIDDAARLLTVSAPAQLTAGVGVYATAAKLSIFNASSVTTTERGRAGISAVLPRVVCRSLDAYDGVSVDQWALLSSLPAVGRFDVGTSWLYEKTQKPLLMLFADLDHKDLPRWLRLLSQTSAKHRSGGQGVLFVYADGVEHSHRMSSLGLAADPVRLPALSFNFVTDRHLLWQPAAEAYRDGSAVLTSYIIDSLVQRYLHGDGADLVEDAAPEVQPVPTRDFAKGERRSVPNLDSLSLEDRLRFVLAITQENFRELVLDPAKDVAVYFYTSKGPGAEKATEAAIYINRCAERFKELAIETVSIARMDVARFSVPTQVQLVAVPSVLLFPAFAKDPPHISFDGTVKVQNIMWWIQDHASRKFKLPALPHLDELEAKEYWEQKAALPQERQDEIARANERRDDRSEL